MGKNRKSRREIRSTRGSRILLENEHRIEKWVKRRCEQAGIPPRLSCKRVIADLVSAASSAARERGIEGESPPIEPVIAKAEVLVKRGTSPVVFSGSYTDAERGTLAAAIASVLVRSRWRGCVVSRNEMFVRVMLAAMDKVAWVTRTSRSAPGRSIAQDVADWIRTFPVKGLADEAAAFVRQAQQEALLSEYVDEDAGAADVVLVHPDDLLDPAIMPLLRPCMFSIIDIDGEMLLHEWLPVTAHSARPILVGGAIPDFSQHLPPVPFKTGARAARGDAVVQETGPEDEPEREDVDESPSPDQDELARFKVAWPVLEYPVRDDVVPDPRSPRAVIPVLKAIKRGEWDGNGMPDRIQVDARAWRCGVSGQFIDGRLLDDAAFENPGSEVGCIDVDVHDVPIRQDDVKACMIKEPVPVDEERRQDPILLASSGPATSPVDDSTFLTSIYTSRQDARACDACGKPTFLGRVELSSIDAGTFGPMVQGGASACTACALAGNVLPRNERAMKDFLDKAFRSPTGIEMERIAGQLWKENAIVPPIVPRQAKYKASDHRRVIQAIVQQAPARPSKLPRIRVPSNATVIEALMGASSLSVIEARMPCKVLLFKDPLEHVHVAIIPADGREAPCFAAARTITSLHAGAASGGTSISFHPALRSTPHLHITGPGVSLHVKPSRFPSLPISTGAKPPARDAGVARLGTGEPRERGAPRPSPGRELVVQAGKAEIARTHVYEPSTHHVVIEVAWVGHGRQVRLALGDPDDAPLPGMEQLLQRSMDRWMERGHFPDALIRELHVDRGLADERKASEIEATARIIPVRAGVDEIKSLFQRMAAGPLPIVHGGFFKDWIRSPPVNRSVLVIQENRRPSLPLVGVTVAGIPATEGMERNLGIKLFLPPSSSPPPPFLAWGTTCIVPTSIVDLLPGTRVWSLVVYTAGQWPPRVMDACRAIRASYPSIIERSIRTLVHSPRTTQHVWDKAIGVLEDMTAALAALPGMEGAWAAGLDAIERGTASRRFLARIRVERPLRSWIERGVADGGEI